MDTRWIEVDLDKLQHNFQLVRHYVAPEVKILAVVKADAYGHGLVQAGQLFSQLGADYLGVTEIEEGIALRDQGIKTPILVFSPFLASDFWMIKQRDLTITLSNLEMIEALGEQGYSFCAHLKLETGLGRTGFSLAQIPQCVALLAKYPQIKVKGVYTHFATAMWTDDRWVKEQMAVFEQGISLLAQFGYTKLIKHVANSSAMMKYGQYHLDMVRAGTVLYGQDGGSYTAKLGDALQDAWVLKTKITAIEELPEKHGVGYERTFVTKRPSRIAIVPIGYSLGLGVEPIARPKKMKDLIKVLGKGILRFFNHPATRIYGSWEGKAIPVVGKIGMQLTMLDVTDQPALKVGDTITLPARRTNMSGLIEKRFISNGQVVATSAQSMTAWQHQQ